MADSYLYIAIDTNGFEWIWVNWIYGPVILYWCGKKKAKFKVNNGWNKSLFSSVISMKSATHLGERCNICANIFTSMTDSVACMCEPSLVQQAYNLTKCYGMAPALC